MFTKTEIFASIATATMMVSTPAFAAPAGDATTAGVSLGKTQRADNPDQRYCIVSDVPGSRIQRRECRALGQWRDEGIDPRLLPRRR